MPFRMDFSFDHEYEVNALADLPGAGRDQYHFPPEPEPSGKTSTVLEVVPHRARAWVGVFVGEYEGSAAMSGCFACPDGRSLAVISTGSGYIVDAESPQQWKRIEVFPIIQVEVGREPELLLFADFTGIVAYGRSGLLWSNNNVSWDGIRIEHVSSRTVEGVAWDAPANRDCRFVLDVTNGTIIEGVTSR